MTDILPTFLGACTDSLVEEMKVFEQSLLVGGAASSSSAGAESASASSSSSSSSEVAAAADALGAALGAWFSRTGNQWAITIHFCHST